MPKYSIEVPVGFTLDFEVVAETEGEALEKVIYGDIEPQDAGNFHSFYEYLGDEWRHVRRGAQVIFETNED